MRGKQRILLENRLKFLEEKKIKKEETNFDIIANTISNKEKKRLRGIEEKNKKELIRRELVKSGEMEDTIYMAGKHKLNDQELTDLPIGKLLQIHEYIVLSLFSTQGFC